jgi:outer membrane protein assembly factor BamD (BamD/ComL family)
VKNLILFLITTSCLLGCAPNPSNPVNSAFHDLTAHYNAYFIANEHIKAIESGLHDNFQWNYNRILPLYAPFDSTNAAQYKEQLTDCIEKASLAIQRHPGSKWEYPSYILVGKARYYGLEFPDAVETYKYVNTKSESNDHRHEALIDLMRVFTANKEYKNAIAVADYLKKEEMSNKNQHRYFFNQAFLYQQRGNLDLMVQNLVKAEELQTANKDKARIQFVIGQVYQQLGFNGSAYYYYEKSLKSNPSYELSFYTKLNMAQVTEMSEKRDIKTVRKYFKRLLNDRKNLEYNDKIYYEMGIFEQKNGNLDVAIAHFNKSIRVSQNNARQKGLSYLSLAKINYDSLKNFEVAKLYYDSTVQSLPKDEERYAAIKTRQEVLAEFVKNLLVIRTNDSLLMLSKLSPDSLQKWALQKVIADSISTEKAKEQKERLAKEQVQRQTTTNPNQTSLIATSNEAGWYFNNPTSVSKGYTAFQRKWKNRVLEDNWRRSVKFATSISTEGNATVAATQPEARETNQKQEAGASVSDKVAAILSAIPTDDEQRAKLDLEVLDAMYALGNIYNFKLDERLNAIETFYGLINRYPNSKYEPEVLYQLYLLQQSSDPERSQAAAQKLVREHPESIYAKLIENPNYREESFAATMQLQQVYKEAYALYKREEYKRSMQKLDSVYSLYPENEFSDNVQLLRILNLGKLEGQHKYQFELDNFVKNFSESELIPYAQDLIKQSDAYKANLYSSSKGKFINNLNQKHYFVLVYPISQDNSTKSNSLFQSFISLIDPTLKYANLLLSEEYSMSVINEIRDKELAMEYYLSFKNTLSEKNPFVGQKHYLFVITEENFDILYKTKDIEGYKTFFERNYK